MREESASPSGSRTVGTPTTASGKFRSATIRRDQHELLVVLLAEERDVRADDVEQLRDDGQHPGEVARAAPRPPARRPSGPGSTVASWRPRGYMSSTPGREHQLDALVAADLQVRLQRARVAGEVLGRAELQGVDEDRHRDDPGARHAARVPDQLAVALVQRTHRRDERDAPAGRAQRARHRR